MIVRIRFVEVYRYDILGFFWYVCDFDGFLFVLFCGYLIFVILIDDLFYYIVYGWKLIFCF